MSKPEVRIIVAVTLDGAIGKDGDQLYYISEDLRHFKALTMGWPVVMGRHTFEALPRGPLPGRRNVVVTRNELYAPQGAETATSVDAAVSSISEDVCYVIGGGQLYRAALPLASVIELTVIDVERSDADTFFPEIDMREWEVAQTSEPHTDPRSELTFRFITLRRSSTCRDTEATAEQGTC
ncbi:MAG: dihydrofolate reductase [Muribaculaceae bacterium]|nr:dihydrofolate reductase [Muribaculaceae bacterium]